MSTKFVLFKTAGTDESEPILVNPPTFAPFAKAVRLRSRWSWMTGKVVAIRTWRVTLNPFGRS